MRARTLPPFWKKGANNKSYWYITQVPIWWTKVSKYSLHILMFCFNEPYNRDGQKIINVIQGGEKVWLPFYLFIIKHLIENTTVLPYVQ